VRAAQRPAVRTPRAAPTLAERRLVRLRLQEREVVEQREHVLRRLLDGEERAQAREHDRGELRGREVRGDREHVREDRGQQLRVLHLLDERGQDLAHAQARAEAGQDAREPAHERDLLLAGLCGERGALEEVERRDRERVEEGLRGERGRRGARVRVAREELAQERCGGRGRGRGGGRHGAPWRSGSSAARCGTGLPALSRRPESEPWFRKGGSPLRCTA
jgi:hypothetical protein